MCVCVCENEYVCVKWITVMGVCGVRVCALFFHLRSVVVAHTFPRGSQCVFDCTQDIFVASFIHDVIYSRDLCAQWR